MKKSAPPPPIMAAIAAMLKPYGIDADKLLQEDSKTAKSNGDKYWLADGLAHRRSSLCCIVPFWANLLGYWRRHHRHDQG